MVEYKVENEEEGDEEDPSPNSSVWCQEGLFLVGRMRDIFLLGAIEKVSLKKL